MSKKIALSLFVLALVAISLLNEGVRNELVAHSNRFRSIIVYGTSGITNSGTLTQTGAITATGGITSGSNIVSDTDGTDDLGTTAVRWDQVYADEVIWNKGDTVASAVSNFTLGSDGNYYVISGTAQIDSIAIQTVGKLVMLQTAAACTLLDGGNLKLAGAFNATAADVISLVSDGTNWHEVSRSAN